MEIDYERLELALASDIHTDHREDFNISEIVQNATLNEDEETITIKASDFWFKYDANTYEQIAGGGGIKVD